jgi:hypothetical protein
MEDKGLQFYEYVKSQGVVVPESFEEFQSGLENPDTAAQFMKYLSTKNIKTPGSVTEFQDVILNNADIPKEDVPENMSFEELMEKKEKEKEEAEKFRNTPLSPLIPGASKREGEVDLFDEAIIDIDKDFMFREEESVVPELQYRFKDYGFEFDESGLGDMLTVTAPNGEIGEFNLDSSEDAGEESLKLKSFLIKNRGSEDVEAIKRIEARQAYETQRFMNQEQVELATKSLNDDMDVLVSEEKDLYNVYQEISEYGKKFEGLTQGDLDDNPELKADYDSYKARVDEFQSMSDVLKNKRGDLIDRRWDLTQSVGAYFDMKKEQGEFSSALYNEFLLGIGDVAATGGDIMIEASIGMSDYGEVSPSVYTEMMLEQALSDKRISKEDYDRLSGMLESEVKPATDSKLDLDEFEKEQERLRLLARGDYEETKKAKGDKRYEKMVSQSDLVLKELKGLLKEEAGEEVLGGGVIKTTTEGVYDDIESSVKDKIKKKRKYGEDGRWKGGRLESIQNGLVELIGSGNVSDEYVEAQQDSFLGGSLLGLSRSLPAMAAGLVSGGATTTVLMGAQINAALKEEMANNPEFDDVSENERMAISAPIAIAAGALESFGIRNIKTTSGLINGLVRRAFTKSAGRQLTAKSFDRIIREDIKSGLARGTLKITGAGLAEAETGAAQEFAEVGMKKIYNYIKDEEKFETATGMQWIQDIAMAGAQEAVGGFILGSPGAVITGLSNTYDEFTNDLPDMVYEAFNIVIGDPNIREGYISSIKSQVADGSLTQEEGDEKIETFKMAGGIAQSIPSDMSMSEKKKAFKLLYERQLLESSIEGKDKSLTKSEQKQINEINKKLETLREGAIKRSTKREKDIETSKNVVEGINKKISEVKEKLEDKSITKKEKDNLQKQLTELENDLKIEEDKSTETDKQEATDIESFFEGTEGEDGPNFAINSGGKSQVLSDKQEAIVNKIKSQVEKVANSLKSRVPGIRILLHENTDDYTKITGKSGGGAYIIEDGKGTIHINLSKARASTLAHEAFHAVFLHKLKTDSNAARAAIAMIKSVEKVLDPNSQLAKDIKAFAALYEDQGEGIQNEEKLAELVGRISSEYKTLSRSAKDKVIDLLKKLANKIGFKFEEGFGKSDQDVIDLLNTLARKFESGEEITEEDVDVIGRDIDSDAEQSTIIRSNKRFQADFTDIESGLTYVYDKNSEEFKRLEKEGYITRDKSINDFNGSFMILHQPDSAFSGTIKKGDTVLVQGKGGVYYPIKFHDKGYFWASTAGAADDLAKSMNKSMDKNGGKIYLALTSAPADKVLSSTNAANGVMELFIALSRDRKLKIRNIRSILINAYNDSKFKEGNKKGGKILTINKNTPMAEVISRISTTLGPEMSVFDERKAFSGSVIKGVVESIGSNKENQEAHNRLADIFGEGMMAEDLVVRSKSGSKVSVANLTQAVSQMLTEPILREGKSKTQNGLIYAVLEIDGPVESMEAKAKGDHESYPKTIKSTNNTKSTLHLLTDRVKWQNITIDPETKDTVNKSGKVLSNDKEKAAKGVMVDRHTQIMSPSAGITLYPLEINTSGLPKKPSAREQKQDTPQTREDRTERLAPNGKRSNLTDVQYDTVRTPAFKKWFGDWENDPKNASKVVDENGEPQVVWRGRDKTKGDVGDIIDIGKTNEGAFFADNKEAADLFMSEFQDINKNDYELIESFLNIRKPEVFNDFWNDFSEARNRSRKGKYTPKKGVDGVIIKDDVWLTQTEIDWKEGQFDEFGNELDEEVIKEIALKGKQFIALDSNQIKLADGSNATFDPDAPSIREDRINSASKKLKTLFDRDNVQLTIPEAKEMVAEVYDWTTWYDGLSSYVNDLFGEYGEDVLSILPLSSMAANSAATVGMAINNVERIYKGDKPKGVAEYYGYVTDFLEGKGIKSDKMYNFFKALSGDKNAVAVDMHVYSIIMGKDPNKKQVNPANKKEFDRAKEFVNTLAEELELAPREVQAALWALNILRTGGKPDSYEQYFEKQVKSKNLKQRIEGWRKEGYKPFSEIRKTKEQQISEETSIREDRMVESPSRMTAPQIILEARQNNFSDAAIRDYLIRVRGYSVKQVDEALKFDIDAFESLPQAFRTITGGVVAGLKLYNRVKAYRDKLTKANNKLKNPQLSESEIKAKVAKKLAELKGSVKYGTKTNKQIDDDVRKFRSKEESNNKKRKTKLTAAQVNDRVRAFREKLQAEKQAKIDLRNKAITNFEKTERKANEKRKPRMSEQEIMDKAIEFLEKQPEYLAERETYTVGSEAKGTKQTKFREGLTVAQASLVSAFQSNVGVRPTKSVAEKLKKARRMIRDRKKGARDLNKIKNELRHFIRRALPNDLYKKKEVLDLIKLVTDANEKNIENVFEQVEKRVTEMNNKTLIQKISKMLDLKQYAKKDRNGKIIKGRRIDPETLKRLEGIVANLIDPSMDVDELVKAVEERVDSLQKQIDELNSKEELSVEDMTKIVDLNIAMQYNQSLLLENDNIYKTAALDNVHNSLGEIITFGRAVLQDRINKRHKSYVEQLERAYYDITGNKIDMSQEGAKEELAEMSRGMRNKAKKDRVDRRVRGIFQKLKSSLNGGIQDLSGYMNIISTLPGEMFEGEMQDIVTDRVDASTRMYKGRMLQIKEVLETKLREIYGRGWEKEIQESRKSIEETEAILGYQLSRDEIIYLYNQYRDPSNHSNFEAQYGGKYAEKMEKLFEFLTKEDKAFAEYQVNELFPSLYEYYNPIYKRIYDAEMPWSMVYAGPLRYDGGTETPFDLLQGTTSFQKSMAPGYAIKRVNNKRKISEESNINNMFSYIQEMEYWAAYAENLRDINKLFQNDDIRNAITSIHGEKLMKLINESISTISKRGGQVSEFDRFINSTNSLFSITRLALSPVIYLKQLTSAIAYANDIGYRNWAKYSVKNIIEFRKLSKEIMENSVYLKDRYDKSITRTLETYKEENSIFNRPKYFIGDKGISKDDVVSFMMGLVTAGDRHAIIIGGMPNYKLYKDRYMKENPEATEQEAVDYAIIKFEKDTKKAQQSSDLQDKDLTQTGNPIMRGFNMFLTSPKQYLRKELYAIRQIYTKIRQWDRMAGKGTVGQNLRTLTTFHVVLPMIFQYVTSGLPGLLADWEDEDAEDLLRAAILGNINGLFILGDFFVAAADFAQDKPWAFNFKNLSVFNIMSEVGTSVRRYQKLKPGPKKDEAYWNMIATIAQAKTIRKWITNLQELPDSKNINEVIMRLLNYSEYQISGGKKSKKNAPKPSEKEKSLAQEISEFQGS